MKFLLIDTGRLGLKFFIWQNARFQGLKIDIGDR